MWGFLLKYSMSWGLFIQFEISHTGDSGTEFISSKRDIGNYILLLLLALV